MSWTLYILNIRVSRLGLMVWPLLLGAYGVLLVYLYPSIRDSTVLFEFFRELPLQAQSALGLNSENIAAIFPQGKPSFYGVLSIHYLIWWPIFVGILAIVYGGGSVAGDMRHGYLHTILYQPLRRYKFLTSKSAFFATALVVLWLTSWLATLVAAETINVEISLANSALAYTMALLLTLAIFSYSMLFSAVFANPNNAISLAALTTFALYMLNFLEPMYGSADWLRYTSLFYHYKPFELLSSGDVTWTGISVLLGVSLIGHIASIVVFQRRDISL